MRVLFIASGLGLGGAETALERLIPHLQAKRVTCEVVSLGELGEVGARMLAEGVTVHALGMKPPKPSLRGLLRLWQVVRRYRPDVIQGCMYHGNIAAHVARLAAPRAKLVEAIHQTLARPELDPWTTRAVIRLGAWLSRLATKTIYVARAAQAQHLAAGYAARTAEVIPNGIDTRRFSPDFASRQAARAALGAGNEVKLVATVGRYHPVKNQVGFLRAAGQVAATFPEARFVMIGAGLDAGNAELAPILGEPALQGKVAMLGRRTDVEALMPGFDLFVLSSLSEGLPNVVAEAMACGVPCVVTDVGDAAWMVGETGWLAQPGDVQSLADAMSTALRCEQHEHTARGEAARKRAVELFAIDAVARAYLALYRAETR